MPVRIRATWNPFRQGTFNAVLERREPPIHFDWRVVERCTHSHAKADVKNCPTVLEAKRRGL